MLCFLSEPKEDFGAPAPWSFEGSPARHRPSDLVWSGDDNFMRETWRPPSFVEKLLSGTRGQSDRDWWPSSNTLSECYNNVDVGVPLWLTEPWDKHPRQEFASHIPLFKLPHFILAILVCLYFRRVESC